MSWMRRVASPVPTTQRITPLKDSCNIEINRSLDGALDRHWRPRRIWLFVEHAGLSAGRRCKRCLHVSTVCVPRPLHARLRLLPAQVAQRARPRPQHHLVSGLRQWPRLENLPRTSSERLPLSLAQPDVDVRPHRCFASLPAQMETSGSVHRSSSVLFQESCTTVWSETQMILTATEISTQGGRTTTPT